ncbi:alpha/beta hydrolase-fold protein [Flavobacterium sp.]|uniref:alpha/beta hydrolase n=1 Tax=Flavobacterium sp. TaxID=239 RepID=UPI00286D6DB3|nr:alpha/beta hydrolase-fold protein [Flavobacterium sp.]
MKKISILLSILSYFNVLAQEIKVTSGKIERLENFKSKYVDARNIDIWLPDGYSNQEKYAVLYMHDGKMLFDAEATWNKLALEIDETAGRLISTNKVKKFIVVGIWNNGDYRHSEYFPEKIISNIPETTRKIIVEESLKSKPQADNYLKFITSELKPYIDKNYSTNTQKKSTFMAGASMGGLISLYAICEYPTIFGGVAGISTHSPMISKVDTRFDVDADIASKFRDYLKTHLPNPKNHKIYMDYGDQTIDAFYKNFQAKIDDIMKSKGYSEANWITKFFPGENHSEASWKKRLDFPLVFLLGK